MHNYFKPELLMVGLVTTRNVAKKTLPENVANFVGGYIFGEPYPENVATHKIG